MDISEGTATFTHYTLDPNAGTFQVNKYIPDGWVGVAAPYAWFKPEVGAAHGACTGGISASNGVFPHIGKQGLCYQLTDTANQKTINAIVVEIITCEKRVGMAVKAISFFSVEYF